MNMTAETVFGWWGSMAKAESAEVSKISMILV